MGAEENACRLFGTGLEKGWDEIITYVIQLAHEAQKIAFMKSSICARVTLLLK